MQRRGLLQVLAGTAPVPAWRWRLGAGYTALTVITVALCWINMTHVHPVAGYDVEPQATAWQVLVAFVVVLPLPLAVRYPLLAWRAGWLALLLTPLLPAAWWGGWPWGPPQILALLGAFCLAGIRLERPALCWMSAITLLPWAAWLIRDIPDLNGPASATIVFVAAAIAADSVGSRLRAQRALAAQTERTEAEQERRAVLEERTRIARELHDVVAHHMSLIAVQAETAPYRLSGLPENALTEFASMSEVAREALAEMRRLLGVLRQDQPARLELEPQPALADVPALVDAARRAGVEVELWVPAGWGKVPAGVGVCAYRIVQESLSNASQHAPGAAVTVTLDHDAEAVQLRVANGPGGPPTASGERGPGHGLTGMRERVALLGGSLSAGPTLAGGFMVTAVLPLAGPVLPGMSSPGAGPTRCLIADDQAMVREGFAAVLAAQPGLQVVGQAADGAEALRQARHLKPDVVLMDVRMPVMDGLQATREILGKAGTAVPRVLMLTTFDLDDYVYAALRAGASGFLLKDATAAELVNAVRVVAAGDALLAPSVTRRLIADFARQRVPVQAPLPALAALTQRETEVLRLIARGLSNAEISDALVIAEQTTKTYVGRILAKLNLRDRAQAVVVAYETGLVTPGGG